MTETLERTNDRDGGPPSGPRTDLLPVVGIGASAGGLAALKELFGYMPPDSGLAFVVVVHLSPEHESHLPDLLQPHTSMPVTPVTETLQMEPNHVYVIPPGRKLKAIDTHLRLDELEEERRKRARIDHFFRTLARSHHETAIGVVLTGTGSDGTNGLKKIREQGGLTIAQDPAEAEYDGMPQSAIGSGIVDLVLPLAKMPEHIIRLATTEASVAVSEADGELEQSERQLVLKVLARVRTQTGHTFSRFKPATVTRRIRRRMQMHQIEQLEEYLELLHHDPEEARHLLDDLLVTATNSFRNRESFEALETSKEGLQSINEELATVNQQNRQKVEELSQLSSDLQSLLAATDIATLFLDRQLRIMRFTPPLAEIFDVLPSDRGRSISDLTHRLGDSALISDAERVLEMLVPVDREISSEDGRHYLMRLRPYRSSDDRIDGVVITFVDITEREQTEKQLRESEERYRLILECATEFSIFMIDLDGRIEEWSPGAERMLGYTEDEVLGRPVDVIFVEEDRAAGIPARELARAAENGQALDVRWHLRKDGQRIWADGVVVALEDDAGRLRGFAKLMQDETERKNAEDALRESEQRYRTLFESIDEGFCVIEVIFDEDEKPVDYRFLEVNPAFERHTGLQDAEGKTIREFAPEHEQYWFEIYGRVAETGEPERVEHHARWLGGRWFDVFAFRLGGEGSHRVAVLFNDITEQKHTLQKLEDLNRTLEQRVEERTREVQRLASTLSMAEQEERRRIASVLHDDLQQLLFGVHLRLDYLAKDVAALDERKLQMEFDEARQWVGEAIETTRQLTVDLNPPILKNEGLAEALGWLASQMREKHHLEVKLRLARHLRVPDEDLRSLFFQAVRELLFNVVKHADVAEATVTISRQNDRVHIVVADHGRGFDVEKAQTAADKGAGFGLFSVRERLRLIGGSMDIESTPGQGTRVSITAPTDHT